MQAWHGRQRFAWLGLALAMALGASAGATIHATGTAPVAGLSGRIAYSTPEGIWVANADGSGARQVTHPREQSADYDPALSPDGATIAFRSSRATPADSIMLVDADGANERSRAVAGRRLIRACCRTSGTPGWRWSPARERCVPNRLSLARTATSGAPRA